MADIKDPIAWCEEMLKEGSQAQAFFLPIETRPKEYPALTKQAQVYHGSPHEFEVLEPRNLTGDKGSAEMAFASPSRSFILGYAGGPWRDKDLSQSVFSSSGKRKIHLRELRPGVFDEFFGGKSGYVYKLPEEEFHPADRGFGSRWEVISKKPVKVEKKEIIENVLKELQEDPDTVLHSYDISDPGTKETVRRRVKLMLDRYDMGEENKKKKSYKSWMLSKAPEEMKELWEELEKEEREKTASQGHVFIAGLPGAGKTTEAERISKEMGLPLISLDGIPRTHGTPPPNTETVRKFIREYLDEPHVIEGAQILGMNKDDFEGSKVILVDQPEDVIVNRLINRGLFVDGGERLIGEGARGRIEKEHRDLAPIASEFVKRVKPEIISPKESPSLGIRMSKEASMDKCAQKHKQLIGELRSILSASGVPDGNPIVGGSGILGALGLKDPKDLDVHVTPKAFKSISKHPDARTGEASMSGDPVVRFDTPSGEIEIFTGSWNMGGKSFARKVKTVEMDGIRHWAPEVALDWKQRMNRPKDQPDIQALQSHMKQAAVQPVQGVQPVEGVEDVADPVDRKQQQQQELDAWGRWINDRNAQDFKFLLDSYMPFMNYMGQRHLQTAKTRGTLPPSTIKADMIQNFHRAMETYDPNKGQLNTHIGNHLRHTGRFVRSYSNIGKMPDPRSRLVWQYKDRETILTERLGRPPSSIEMADDLGISQKDIELLRTEIRKDIIVDPTTSGLGSIAPESPKAMEQLNFLHMELSPDQQNILEYTYGMHGRPAVDSNEELARIVGISPQKVRAIKRQIAKRYEKRYR